MTLFSAPNARSAREASYALALTLTLLIAPMSTSHAQIQFVSVGKSMEYAQTSATDVNVRPLAPNYGGPYGFSVAVAGANIAGITVPTFTGPINFASVGSWYNGGKLVYVPADGEWGAGPNGNNWGSPTLADLNSKFPSGNYTIIVNGTSVPLQLTGDAYPSAPLVTLTGGAWSNGKYLIDPTKALTITTSVFTGYGTHRDDAIAIYVQGLNETLQLFSTVPGTKFLSRTIPASTFVTGKDYKIAGNFVAIVDLKPNAALPGSLNAAFYNASTAVIVSAVPPVFPLVVTGAASVNTPVATVSAAIQYRPQDVGTTGSVYVFALAPANMVKNVSAEAFINNKGPVTRGTNSADAPLPCVLGQLTASGQLTAVTAGSLQAFLTGVLSSQGATVSVLNGVSTALLSGAVFYVGYGSNSTAMINGGINRSVVTVPGTQVCQPQAPQTGWWWYPAQDGRGFGIEVRGNTMFMSGYLYDDTGHATWVVAAGQTSLDGSFFNNTLYHVSNGQTLTGAYKAPTPVTFDGPITLSFTDARNGTLIWAGGSIPVQRFDDVIGSGNGVTPSFVPENGWWWNEAESGRGFFMEFKNNFAFIAGYMYEASGPPVWYVAQGLMSTPQTFSSNWYQAGNGQTMTGPYKKPILVNSNVGAISIVFTDAANATLTLPTGTKVAITKHRF